MQDLAPHTDATWLCELFPPLRPLLYSAYLRPARDGHGGRASGRGALFTHSSPPRQGALDHVARLFTLPARGAPGDCQGIAPPSVDAIRWRRHMVGVRRPRYPERDVD